MNIVHHRSTLSLGTNSFTRLVYDQRAMPLDGVELRDQKRVKPLKLPKGIPNGHFCEHNGLTVFTFQDNFFLTADPEFLAARKMLHLKSDHRLEPLTTVDYTKLERSTDRLFYRLIRAQLELIKLKPRIKLHLPDPDPKALNLHCPIDSIHSYGQTVEMSGRLYRQERSPKILQRIPKFSQPLVFNQFCNMILLTDQQGRLFFTLTHGLSEEDLRSKVPDNFQERDNLGPLNEEGVTTLQVSFRHQQTEDTYRYLRLQQRYMVIYRSLHHQSNTVPLLQHAPGTKSLSL